jgi:hypothetical protein
MSLNHHGKNMKLIRVALMVGCFLASEVSAKEYLGFDLCRSATLEKIEEIIKNNGGNVEHSIRYENTDDGGYVEASKYSAGGQALGLTVYLYKNKIIQIYVNNANSLIGPIESKYGKHIDYKHNFERDHSDRVWTYADRAFSNVAISFSDYVSFESEYKSFSLSYLCKSLDAQKARDNQASDLKTAKKTGL